MSSTPTDPKHYRWDVLYKNLTKAGRSLIPPDANGSTESYTTAWRVAAKAEGFTSWAFVKFSQKKRAVKDAVITKKFEVTLRRQELLDEAPEFKTKKELSEWVDVELTSLNVEHEVLSNLLEDITVFMTAINKVSGQIKHFREDLGRRLRLREIEHGR